MTFFLPIGACDGVPVVAPAKYLTRHGLITGSTGTGKSVTIIGMAEAMARLGVPSIVTDVKGDLSGLAAPSTATTDGGRNGGLPWWPEAAPVKMLDVYGSQGSPIGASLSTMGAPLVARALGLSDTQTGVLEVAYAVAADTGQPLHTLQDLRDLVAYCSEERATIGRRYGLVSPASVAAIGRAILRLERAGGAAFFRETNTTASEFLDVARVNLLDCVQLVREPRLYGAVLLWLLDLLARELPEVGDPAKPKLCIFLDEAHLIFSDCAPDLLRAVDQTVRLIRSKGVGVYFASQSPADIPDSIARQLHLRIQHSLRAVTPRDRLLVRAAAESMPPAQGFKVAAFIESMPTGTALLSYMDATGRPTPTQVVKMAMPRCRLSPLTVDERAALYTPAPVQLPRTAAAPNGRTKHGGLSLHIIEKIGVAGGVCFGGAVAFCGVLALSIGYTVAGAGLCIIGTGAALKIINEALYITRPDRMPD